MGPMSAVKRSYHSSLRDGAKPRARNPYSRSVVMGSGLLAALGPGMTAQWVFDASAGAQSAVRVVVGSARHRPEARKGVRAASRLRRRRAATHHRSLVPPAERFPRPAQSAQALGG